MDGNDVTLKDRIVDDTQKMGCKRHIGCIVIELYLVAQMQQDHRNSVYHLMGKSNLHSN